MVDSGDPPSAKGVGSHRLIASKNFKEGKVSHTLAPGLGETDLEWEFQSHKSH